MSSLVEVPDEIVRGLVDLVDLLERADDGDVDSPIWDRDRRLAALQDQLARSVRAWEAQQTPTHRIADERDLEGVVA